MLTTEHHQETAILSMVTVLSLENTINPLIAVRKARFPLHGPLMLIRGHTVTLEDPPTVTWASSSPVGTFLVVQTFKALSPLIIASPSSGPVLIPS